MGKQMSNKNQQEVLLNQLKAENQKLQEFKKLNNLMLKTMQAFTENIDQSVPFSSLFSLIAQEVNPDIQLIITSNQQGDGVYVVASTNKELEGKDFILKNTEVNAKNIFDKSAVFNSQVKSAWPSILQEFSALASSAIIQPVKITNRCYAIVLLMNNANGFSAEASSVISNYSSFIASILTLMEYRHVSKERDNLFAQQKRMETSMARQGKLAAIGQLAAGVAHELNNPLGFIYSNLNTFKLYIEDIDTFVSNACKKSSDTDNLYNKSNLQFIIDDSKELLSESLEGARRARDIIKNLRNFSHPDETTISKVNILKLVEDAIKIANTQFKKQTKILIKSENQDFWIEGNITQLCQVILNLISNAHHSINHSNGLIEINIIRTASWINIEVIDNGNGIDKADIPHLFEPFFTTKEIGQGTGLGLPISRAIVEQHNGCLALDYTGPKGTKFIISLPEYTNASSN